MTRTAWARSGARPATARGARPAGSWAASVARARAAFDGLTPPEGLGASVAAAFGYSDAAKAAILSVALGLWADTAASMGDEEGGDDG